MTVFRRHALVWLSQAPIADEDQERARVERWHAEGRPFMVCRRRDDRGDISLGFCTTDDRFPDVRPRRVGAHGLARHIVKMDRPPALREVACCGPAEAHADAFVHLTEGAARAGIELRVFGSWMWQALTGEPHVRPTSDIDLLVDVSSQGEAAIAAAFLGDVETKLPFKLDGELSFPGLGEVHWREYRGDAPEILLKSIDSMRLVRRAELGP
jgi:phosphoribosyl-dephospho-CoA transferase